MEKIETLGPFRYYSDEYCFPLGRDTLLLGEFATVRPGARVCDLGCGGGALPLLLLARAGGLKLTGLELIPPAAERARKNLEENGVNGEILTGDLRNIRVLLPAGRFDLVVSNPPYFAAGTGGFGGAARMEACCTLEDVCAAAGWLLKNGGRFALVYRPERLAELMEALRHNGLEPKRMQLAQHRADSRPFAVLLEAVRQGKPGIFVLPVRLLHASACL